MAATRSLTQNQMAEEIAARLSQAGWNLVHSDDAERDENVAVVKEVLGHLHETVLDEIEAGIPVNVCNLARLSLRYVAAKPRRWVTNPMSGEEVWAESRPAMLAVKARATTTAKNAAPSTRSVAGKQIAKAATARARKRERAAKARERAA